MEMQRAKVKSFHSTPGSNLMGSEYALFEAERTERVEERSTGIWDPGAQIAQPEHNCGVSRRGNSEGNSWDGEVIGLINASFFEVVHIPETFQYRSYMDIYITALTDHV
ncbi:uncharacterized protein AFUA_2G00300 [Aspergillus fumigatus Af293]|uniref:Uncharacterized protein n=1 Tax=Aspergillus fumigatus (strain ATCC MYA-4609 / CBS 101355 / FGSC A1100 / Af293) TaxID=330879 RepID=Q4WIX7_ASPFU|nr:hypothetical protein AFUA_2G00300 [Aspergillus fumigatus Af293]EAL87128.1 hypothetical protein AFUA_2G00300 [Aspergillus fumigatus Af293]